eukprot:TRINITY_DN111522_c0_g1_i1.p1 TRINITY_DN111522_c0_g1~~TRINITY_DN111522_c0_g1_i1.p1  ORF type:complete len:350 (-),score=100.23 TRINITY_DN111522_c0_g1_i1:353-1402(-)
MFARSIRRVMPVAARFASSQSHVLTSAPKSNTAKVMAAGLTVAATTWMVTNQPAKCDAAVDWNAVKAEIIKILENDKYKDSSYDGATPGPLFLRLAWHSAGTFCKHTCTGGSAGATMRFDPELSWGANAGLKLAQDMLEPVKKKFPQVSYSDLWIYAACVAIEEMGGNPVPFKPGRKDKASGKECPVWEGSTHKDGRLPGADCGSPDKTAAHLRYIFNRMGFDDREIVALSGAHGLGACHLDRSGFWGPWTRAPTTVSNEYYRELLENTWTIKTTHKGKKWTGPCQFEDPTGELMMLPSDMVIIQDKAFRKHAVAYAKDDALFQKDFAAVCAKLFDLGHACQQKKGWFS